MKHKEFKPGGKVLLFNLRVNLFRHGKLRSKWEGPFKVVDTSTHGAITIQNDTGNTFKVNGQWLKIYFEPQINMVEEHYVIELIEFSHYNPFNLPHKIETLLSIKFWKFKFCLHLILVTFCS